ncbi:MAG TPA: hypothetical protein VJS11_13600 [Acidobacteriaceae bacterium]|nr:hypothetical protein [Acidobacteriaceae bacterium]
MHVLFTKLQIAPPSTRPISPTDESPGETKFTAPAADHNPTLDPDTEIQSTALQESTNADFADPDCADWT